MADDTPDNPLSIIGAAIAKAQAGVDVERGDVFIRGPSGAVVTGVADGRVRWQSDDGTAESGTAVEFRSRALRRLDLGAESMPPKPKDAPDSLTDEVWRYLVHAGQIAKTTALPPPIRVVQLARTIRRAPTTEAAAVVRRWIASLATGVEPKDMV